MKQGTWNGERGSFDRISRIYRIGEGGANGVRSQNSEGGGKEIKIRNQWGLRKGEGFRAQEVYGNSTSKS